MDCDFVARGETDDEILRKAQEHAGTAHGMDQVSPDMEDKILDNIREDAERRAAARD
jgi:predicted small metal-binding protein